MQSAVTWSDFAQQLFNEAGLSEIADKEITMTDSLSNAMIANSFRGKAQEFREAVCEAIKKPLTERRGILSSRAMQALEA